MIGKSAVAASPVNPHFTTGTAQHMFAALTTIGEDIQKRMTEETAANAKRVHDARDRSILAAIGRYIGEPVAHMTPEIARRCRVETRDRDPWFLRVFVDGVLVFESGNFRSHVERWGHQLHVVCTLDTYECSSDPDKQHDPRRYTDSSSHPHTKGTQP